MIRDEFRRPRDTLLCLVSDFYSKTSVRLLELAKKGGAEAKPVELLDMKSHTVKEERLFGKLFPIFCNVNVYCSDSRKWPWASSRWVRMTQRPWAVVDSNDTWTKYFRTESGHMKVLVPPSQLFSGVWTRLSLKSARSLQFGLVGSCALTVLSIPEFRLIFHRIESRHSKIPVLGKFISK